MDLQHGPGWSGYLLRDIAAELGPDRAARFSRWFAGQTGIIDEAGQLVVFAGDYERFLAWEQRQVSSTALRRD